MLDGFLLAADHQAEAALEAEDTAARADIDVVDALTGEHLRAIDVVAVVAVAAVDDDVAGLHQVGELVDDLAGDPGRDHDPGGPRFFELLDEFVEGGGSGRAVTFELGDNFGADVVDDAVVPVPHQATDDARAHPPQSDHSKLHSCSFQNRPSSHRLTGTPAVRPGPGDSAR